MKNTSIELRDIITNSTDAIYCIGKTISTYKDFLCFYFVCVFYLFIFLKYLPIYSNCLFLKNMLASNKIILKYNGFCLAYLYLIFLFLTNSFYYFSGKQKFYLTIIHFLFALKSRTTIFPHQVITNLLNFLLILTHQPLSWRILQNFKLTRTPFSKKMLFVEKFFGYGDNF